MVIKKFWPQSWSKIFDHMTIEPGRRPNGQNILVALTPPPPYSVASGIFLIDYINDLLMFNVSQPLDLQSMASEQESYKSQNRMATRIEKSLNWNPSQCPTELSKVMAWFDRYNFDLLSGDHLTKVPGSFSRSN